MDAVTRRVINILGQEAGRAAAAREAAPGTNGAPADPSPQPESEARFEVGDAVAYIDLQNLHHFLKFECRVPATLVHLPNLVGEFASRHGLKLRAIRVFTGIHDAEREPERHAAMVGRLAWMERAGCDVVALPLSYYTDHETGTVRAQEKGVDVRIGSEILRDVNAGLRRALLLTQDKDLSQAVKVATEMALERGFTFEAFSPVLEGADWPQNGRCGTQGIAFTTRLPFHVELARRHICDLPERETTAVTL